MEALEDLKWTKLERDESISPPPKRRRTLGSLHEQSSMPCIDLAEGTDVLLDPGLDSSPVGPMEPIDKVMKTIPSPMKLNFIQEFPASSNVDTLSLGSILGDPMIKECWLFNYLFDVHFVM